MHRLSTRGPSAARRRHPLPAPAAQLGPLCSGKHPLGVRLPVCHWTPLDGPHQGLHQVGAGVPAAQVWLSRPLQKAGGPRPMPHSVLHWTFSRLLCSAPHLVSEDKNDRSLMAWEMPRGPPEALDVVVREAGVVLWPTEGRREGRREPPLASAAGRRRPRRRRSVLYTQSFPACLRVTSMG